MIEVIEMDNLFIFLKWDFFCGFKVDLGLELVVEVVVFKVIKWMNLFICK